MKSRVRTRMLGQTTKILGPCLLEVSSSSDVGYLSSDAGYLSSLEALIWIETCLTIKFKDTEQDRASFLRIGISNAQAPCLLPPK